MTATDASATTPTAVAWLWADKAIVRRIRERVPDIASALTVYFALCEIASDNQAEEFEATQQAIASKSGLSVRTVGHRLRELVSIGAIKMEVPQIRSAARIGLQNPIGNGCRSIRNGCGSFRSGEPIPLQIPIREESRINPMPETGGGREFFTLQPEPTKPTPKSSKTPKPRDRNPLFDALIEACGGNPRQMTKAEGKAAAVVLADILSSFPNVTAEEIRAKAENYRRRHRDWALTPRALCGHWSSLSGAVETRGDRSSLERERAQIAKLLPGARTRTQEKRLAEINAALASHEAKS